jgi:signal transduction histidine kinase
MQLILNVLKNSIEAFDSYTRDKTILINAFKYKNQLVIQVKDNGNGFNESVAARLFERGFTTKPSGSGLGLYNCLAIIQSHEGDISLTSEGEGKGALATIGFKI